MNETGAAPESPPQKPCFSKREEADLGTLPRRHFLTRGEKRKPSEHHRGQYSSLIRTTITTAGQHRALNVTSAWYVPGKACSLEGGVFS